MRVRRCGICMIEPRERIEFDLALVGAGGTGMRTTIALVAHAPHHGAEVTLTPEEAMVIALVSPSEWRTPDELAGPARDLLGALVEKELLVVEASDADVRDRRVRDTYWRQPAAVMHFASRWQDDDTEMVERQFAEAADGRLMATFLERLGAPPPIVREIAAGEERLRLPAVASSPLEDLLVRRVTCRNFDRGRRLALHEFSTVLFRTYGARAAEDYAPEVRLLKKAVPSAGGLHGTEAYLLVQRVDGVSPGLYHYHPIEHALEPIRALGTEEAAVLARTFVAAQPYFVDAHVMVMPTARFRRTFWKYRNHAKAYRALILDVGHLSQTMYLAATELGLGAFITAAVNEIDIEQAFGLDPLEEGPLAVTGFGPRGAERTEVEFDPLNAVWPAT
jgi:putative peptide maturation dehydrogenase